MAENKTTRRSLSKRRRNKPIQETAIADAVPTIKYHKPTEDVRRILRAMSKKFGKHPDGDILYDKAIEMLPLIHRLRSSMQGLHLLGKLGKDPEEEVYEQTDNYDSLFSLEVLREIQDAVNKIYGEMCTEAIEFVMHRVKYWSLVTDFRNEDWMEDGQKTINKLGCECWRREREQCTC